MDDEGGLVHYKASPGTYRDSLTDDSISKYEQEEFKEFFHQLQRQFRVGK